MEQENDMPFAYKIITFFSPQLKGWWKKIKIGEKNYV